jgi:hypothetical protein
LYRIENESERERNGNHEWNSKPYLNLGIELSKKLIDLASRQQMLRAAGLTKEIVKKYR